VLQNRYICEDPEEGVRNSSLKEVTAFERRSCSNDERVGIGGGHGRLEEKNAKYGLSP
jgi:hypothetical protein